ncbi:MAG TPA: XrtA/PEP-CTERM system histidine kinase PrsK [Sphingomonas sp.]|nr:XrtA/PEP-CTERM system histidine kinase PrsK [Sphingomonas sp.]
MLATVTLWGHALAALLFGLVALGQVRHAADAVPRLAFTLALGLTALWALAVAGIGAEDIAARVAEGLRDLTWLGFMAALARRDRDGAQATAVVLIYGVVAAIVVAGATLDMVLATGRAPDPGLVSIAWVLSMMVAVSALVLVHHLYATVAPGARHGIRLVVAALALFWGIDLALYAMADFTGAWPAGMATGRGLALACLAPVFALAVHRNGDWSLQVSRTLAYQSLSLAGIALYVLTMVVATGIIAGIGGANARIVQTAFVFGTTAAILTFLSTPWLRAWTRVKLAKHLFRHRYDYRTEWLRFADTLGRPDADGAPLEQRIVKAVADVTDSPAGLLLTPGGAGLGVAGAWNWADDDAGGGDAALTRHLAETGRIVELDALRGADADAAERAAMPLWLLASDAAWALVPLLHLGDLAGVIVLARPPIARRLDWEDFDLLKTLGRQAASYLAEAASHAALAEAQRFDEFNRRFAFIIHDIKNLVSQLTLVARNAERHADNPAFRADMVATLTESADRMNALLQRLSQHHRTRAEPVVPVDLGDFVARFAGSRRAQHPIQVAGAAPPPALADPGRLDRVLGHLVQNAIEASLPDMPVTLALGAENGRAVIDVIDHGCGMSPAFVRDHLFRSFVSSKSEGFGIGVFESRQLTEAMGGTLTVASREGEGTRFRISLPLAAGDLEKAA